jgi:protein-tyrosine phosphatase
MRAAGMTPIITHPERNQLLHVRLKTIQAWVENECLVQVTAQSFLGRFGKRAKDFAGDLMRRGLVHFVASDAHDSGDRSPSLAEAYRYIASTYGPNQAERLFVENPMVILLGESIEPLDESLEPEPPLLKWNWYHFLGGRRHGSLSVMDR